MSGITQALLASYNQGIKFVGAFFQDGSASSASSITANYGGNLVGGLDTTPRAGDVVIVVVAANASSDYTFSASTSGYTKIADLYANNTGTTADCNAAVFLKVMGATPDTTVTITSSTAGFLMAEVYVLRGVDKTTPSDVAATTATTVTNSVAPNPPAITPVTARAAVLAIGFASGSGSLTALTTSGLSDTVSENTSFAAYAMGVIYNWSSGAVDPAAFGGGGSSLRATCSVTMALRPA